MPIYNLLEYSQNYSMTSGSLWNYYRDKIFDDDDNNGSDGKSFKYTTKIMGKTEARPYQPPIPPLNTEVTIPLKYLNNFWRSPDLPLINCEIELYLEWSRNCVLIEENDDIIGVSFLIISTKFTFQLLLCLLMITSNF